MTTANRLMRSLYLVFDLLRRDARPGLYKRASKLLDDSNLRLCGPTLNFHFEATKGGHLRASVEMLSSDAARQRLVPDGITSLGQFCEDLNGIAKVFKVETQSIGALGHVVRVDLHCDDWHWSEVDS